MRTHSCQRIGHGGASALAPANTLAAFDAALDVGIDMVEFDVRAWRGGLVLAHTVLHARRGGNVALHAALAHLATKRFGDVELNVDLKHPGLEAPLLDAWLKLRSSVSDARLVLAPHEATPANLQPIERWCRLSSSRSMRASKVCARLRFLAVASANI